MEVPRIIYYNDMNCALKLSGIGNYEALGLRDSVHFVSSDATFKHLPRALLLSLDGAFDAFREDREGSDCADPGVSEIVERSVKGGITFARRSAGRELYVLLQTTGTVATAYASFLRLLEGEGFKNIFIG